MERSVRPCTAAGVPSKWVDANVSAPKPVVQGCDPLIFGQNNFAGELADVRHLITSRDDGVCHGCGRPAAP